MKKIKVRIIKFNRLGNYGFYSQLNDKSNLMIKKEAKIIKNIIGKRLDNIIKHNQKSVKFVQIIKDILVN